MAPSRRPAPPARPQRLPAHVYRRRRAGCGLLTLAVVVALVWAVMTLVRSCAGPSELEGAQSLPEPTTPPLSSAGFNPGMIISDAEFTNAAAMSQRDIQAFLDTWGKGCRPGEGGAVACLKDYRTDSATMPASASCPRKREGGRDLAASEIIARTARACGINPQVLLVTLQKEQGLITASSGTLRAESYAWATGYGCPDGTNCDRRFAGFDTQVYQAAAQWKRYMNEPGAFAIRAGRTNEIRHGPDPGCGAQAVRVANAATAALYNYTPYVPNADALNGYFEGCGAQGAGNLRFYQYYRAWFG